MSCECAQPKAGFLFQRMHCEQCGEVLMKTERQMSVARWVQKNRLVIDAEILRQCPNVGRLNDRERRLWVVNDEGLYRAAQADGARV